VTDARWLLPSGHPGGTGYRQSNSPGQEFQGFRRLSLDARLEAVIDAAAHGAFGLCRD